MIYPDPETSRQLVRERHAQLQREAWLDSIEQQAVVESRRQRRRVQLRRLRFRLHLVRQP